MTLLSGTRLGPYEIIALLGAGGMGEVYRARDTRLDRTVALKVLASALAGAESFRERFDREARSIAALSHPNICTLHDVGREGGIDYLVMEYLDGETLAARIVRQGLGQGGRSGEGAPLPLDETLRIGTELADALAAAHRAGIVHRDLKPGNVMVTRRGVKVLDFGLAKFAAAGGEALGQSQTLTRPLTGIGAMVGTLPYMAPEQLEGREVDARTDIFALGAILYEMATGKRPFSGASQASLIAAILDREPEPISTVGAMTPPGLDRLVRKCLAKDPDARWQGASDIADELRWIGSGSGMAPLTVTTARAAPAWPAARWRWAILAAAVCVIAAMITAGLWLWRGPAANTPQEAQHSQVTFDGRLLGAAISPDGRTLAYAASPTVDDVRVFVRDLTGGRALEVWKGRNVFQLVWLPDGSQIAVSGVEGDSHGVWAVPRLGGTSRRLASSGPYIAVAPKGSEIALGAGRVGGFRIVSLDGEQRVTATLPLTGLSQLEWTSDRQLAVLGSTEGRSRSVWTVGRDGQDLRELYSSEDRIAGICASPVTGAVYVIRQRQESADLLRVVPGSAPADAPEVLLTGLSVFETGFGIANGCSVSADGQRLVYRRGVQHANLWRLDLSRTGARSSEVTHGTSLLGLPAVSPDGAWIAATRGTDASAQILKIPSNGGEPIAIASGSNPAWSPDGKRLAFISRRGGVPRVWVSDADGHGAKEIPGSEVSNTHLTWLPDGRLAWPSPDARSYIVRDIDSSSPGSSERMLKEGSEGFLIRARFSPRGDRVAAFWNAQRKGIGLWVLTWPGREARFLGAGLWPVGWSADGQWIYAHKHGDGAMLRVSPETGKAEPAGTFPGVTLEGGCDLTPDRRAMICALLERNADAWLVEHFDPQVPRR